MTTSADLIARAECIEADAQYADGMAYTMEMAKAAELRHRALAVRTPEQVAAGRVAQLAIIMAGRARLEVQLEAIRQRAKSNHK